MSVYEQAYATPSRIIGVYRYLLHAKNHRAARDELEEMLMPDNLPLKDAPPPGSEVDEEAEEKKDAPKRDMAKRSIDETIKMGLAAAQEGDVLLHPDLPSGARSPDTGESLVRRTLGSLLLSETNAANHDLAKALAWYLGQDVYAAPSSWHDVDQKHRSDAKALGMTNSRFGQLVHWSRFLGLAWAHAAPEKPGQKASKLALTPDPYWQLRWRVAELFAEQRAPVLQLATVVANLAASVPVLEGGTFRNALEGGLLSTREDYQLSSSTAHAWLRLHEEGAVKLAYRSDGAAYVFPLGDREERFTEVTWQGEAEAMAFQNFICWNSDVIDRVLDTEALEVSDDVFLATHHPIKLYRQDLLQSSIPPSLYDEEDFLRDFLRPANFALVPVLGEAGTGKSHLIRWLAARLHDEGGRHVVLIPRAHTNLKSVLGQILGDLPGKKLDEFRRRLQQETGQLTAGRAAEILLDKLALEVGPNGLHESRDLDEMQVVLIELLPPLFRDSLFRKHFLRAGGIVERLCEHIIGVGAQVERLSERRQFVPADLPLSVPNSTQASQDAQNCYSQLQNNPDLRTAAIAWINDNLDAAIASLLQLRGETLSELMLEVREALNETELVILIEDFAKLQGIDRQLLDALLVKPNQPGRKPLCAMRTAFGCTTGYFKGFAETILQRLDFVVYMDARANGADLPPEVDLEGFVARYLNAVRLGSAELDDWYRAGEGGGQRPELPSACVAHECQYQTTCHAAFGSVSDVGLYPFTPTALRRMLTRASPRGFNPRVLINKVLKHTLVAYGQDLAGGRFPPPGLRAHFGATLDQMLRKKVEDSDPLHAERRLALIDLWTDAGELVDLDPRIHAAFDLPLLKAPNTSTVPPPSVAPPAKAASVKPPPMLPAALEAQLKEIDDWSSDKVKLSYDLTNILRGLVCDAVSYYVDWDAAHLLRRDFCGGRKGFAFTNINFQNQAANTAIKSFLLMIPADTKAIPDAALALRGLLLFRHFRHWKFKDGPKYFRMYASHLDSWGRQVLEFARSTRAGGLPWDPVPAATELLTLDARISGRVPGSKPTLVDYVHALFASPSAGSSASRSKSWAELQSELREARPKLQALIISRTACTKGGWPAVQVIDASQYSAPILALRREWRLGQEVPTDLRDEYRFLRKLRERVDALFDTAIADEKARYSAWLVDILGELGEDAKRDDILAAVAVASARVQAEGVYAGSPADLDAAIERMKTLQLDQLLNAAKRIRDVTVRADLMRDLSSDSSGRMEAVTRFVSTARTLLDASRKRLETDIGALESKGGSEVEQCRAAIASALVEASQLLTELAGGMP